MKKTFTELFLTRLKKGKVVGWFRHEIGLSAARALGHRSILADPRNPKMKDRINKMVKRKRLVSDLLLTMVTKERQKEYFNVVDDIPYMNQVVKVNEIHGMNLPAGCPCRWYFKGSNSRQ